LKGEFVSTEFESINAPHHSRRRVALWSAVVALVAAVVIIAVVASSGSTPKVVHHYNEKASYSAGYAEGVKLAKVPANIVMVSRGFSSPYSVCQSYDYLAAKSLDTNRWIRGCENGFVTINGN
jgi:hypothetical protein